MPKRNRLSSVAYKPLMKALQRAKYEKPGLLARTLLEMFVLDGGRWSAASCIAAGLSPKGGFSKLREKLKDDGFLSYTEQSAMKQLYYPTHRLMPHIEAARSSLYVTISMVDARVAPVESDVAELKERMTKIEQTVDELKKAMEPPITKDKKIAAKRAVATLTLLAKN